MTSRVGVVLRQGLLVYAVVFVVTAMMIYGLEATIDRSGGIPARIVVRCFVYSLTVSLIIFLSGATVGTVVQMVRKAILKRTVVANAVSGIVAGLIMFVLSMVLLSSQGSTDNVGGILVMLFLALMSVVVAVMYGAGYGRYHRG